MECFISQIILTATWHFSLPFYTLLLLPFGRRSDEANGQVVDLYGFFNFHCPAFLISVSNYGDMTLRYWTEEFNVKVCHVDEIKTSLSLLSQEHKDYWLLVIFMLLRLSELDHKKITVQEKVSAPSQLQE